jgi:serine/threonine protein kinase
MASPEIRKRSASDGMGKKSENRHWFCPRLGLSAWRLYDYLLLNPFNNWNLCTRNYLGLKALLLLFTFSGHPRIIHRDIKSANILLDYAFEAQVSKLKLL